jgi:KEOPS complex subunit Cgi121
MGVGEGSQAVVGVVAGGDEAAAVAAIEEFLDSTESVEWGRREVLTEFFDVSDAELAVVDGDLEAVVLERVALLVVEQ